VTALACDERLLLAGIGPAGSGKTTAMRAYAHVLRQHGRRLVPLATSAAAADVLGRELGVQADNLHKFLYEWTSGAFAARLRAGGPVPGQARMFALHPGDVVLVDEAGMAGTFHLDRLVAVAASRGATVRLLGDDRQLPAVESGGALWLIAAQPGTPCLSVLHRFRDPAEAAATLQVRAGDPVAVQWYAANGRVRSGSREAMTQAAYAGWKADMLADKVTLMAAATSADVAALSARARADRVAAGQVEAGGVVLRDGTLAGRWDWIVTRHNDRRLSACGGRDWVKNGDGWVVERRHGDGSLTVRSLAHDGRVRLPAAYVAEHVELLYATTTHRAQGATVDTAHPLITAGMTRENLYVLASRARERTTFYVATHDLPFDEDDRGDQVRSDPGAYAAREVLLAIIATEGAPLSATEAIAAAQEEAGSLAVLVPRYQHAAGLVDRRRYELAATAVFGGPGGLQDDLQDDPAWSQVVLRLQDAEARGFDPAQLLAVVAAQRELGSAGSIAEVLAWRIDGYLAENPCPPASGRPYESGATARERLAEVALAALRADVSARAQAETAWPALIAVLRRAESAGHDAGEILAAVASERELRTARSISEVLAWRIGRQVATRPGPVVGEATPAAAGVLPWLTGPGSSPAAAAADPGIGRHLGEAAELISTRVDELAATAVRHRPPWMLPLGLPPDDPDAERQWLRHVAIVAAYRDQFKVTTNDPRQVLGPYAESGQPGHKAYWYAAESVLAARQLAGLDPATSAAGPNGQAHARLAADIYRTLPESERATISTEMATLLGPLWFGDPVAPDEIAAAPPAHASTLADMLARRGHLTITQLSPRTQLTIDEPLEAEYARRGPAHRLDPAVAPIPQPVPARRRDPPARTRVPNQTSPQPRP
jgi:hypothetical protein